MVSPDAEILVLGAGPLGLGAAWRLHELKHPRWRVVEAESEAGGHARARIDAQGFLRDPAPPVPCFPGSEFDRCLQACLGTSRVREVSGWLWRGGKFWPQSLTKASQGVPPKSPDNRDGVRTLYDWFLRSYGENPTESLWVPWSRRRWGCSPVRLSASAQELIPGGAGAPSSYPARFAGEGDAGALWPAMVRRLPKARFLWNVRVRSLHAGKRRVTLEDGTRLSYDALITSLPLNRLVTRIEDMPELAPYAERLVETQRYRVGIGLAGPMPPAWRDKSWVDIMDGGIPAFRVWPREEPAPGRRAATEARWSLSGQVCDSPTNPVDPVSLPVAFLKSLRRLRWMLPQTRVVSLWQEGPEPWPAPFYGREDLLAAILPRLQARRILSRGRLGGWQGDWSRPDLAWGQGREAVDALLLDREERTVESRRVEA